MVAPWPVVDRWNYIINGLPVMVKEWATREAVCRLPVPELSCERWMCRPAVGQAARPVLWYLATLETSCVMRAFANVRPPCLVARRRPARADASRQAS